MEKDDYLNRRQVMELLEISDKTLYRWVKTGKLCEPLKINRFTYLWYAGDIAALKAKLNARRR